MVQSFQASGGLAAPARPPDRDGSPGRTRTSDMVVNSHLNRDICCISMKHVGTVNVPELIVIQARMSFQQNS